MSDSALGDVKVLDLTNLIAGPYCTKLLADYGAEVIKVERPGIGDGARRLGPFPGDVPHPEKSGLFLHLNTNKQSVTLDLTTQAARAVIKELVKETDIVVEGFRPGTMARWGLDHDTLRSINPTLVMTSISNFGQTGPYRDFRMAEVMVYGMGGEMYSTGIAEREPVKLGVNVLLYQAGATASVATMGALFAARDQGIGQHVDVSIMETQVGSIDRRMSTLIGYQYSGDITGRSPLGSGGGYPYGAIPCSDGYLEISAGRNYFPRAVSMLGSPAELQDPKWYAPGAQRDPDLKEEFDTMLLTWSLEQTKSETWAIAQESRVISAPLNTMEELAEDTEFNSRGGFIEIDHPVAGTLNYPARPFIMNDSPWSVRRPAPLLGQHNMEILKRLGYSSGDVVRLRQQGAI
ncbi:MAG: CoA transferase [Dehalococcoidia bacterium]|nr:CoA transferase [Dehalococcoidia bacterium]